ncbi:Serine--tRNA ligase, mitochondrial [Aspergillus nanangensis]|uniref:serine--tRNA ligase n=1 Tax=Aspergillus nanangensis TaxID=2582783 RepID=A0AAD4CWH8_ASPNN|nr:Serine--tRNA ligase, mitochondrial [Aspergillus nanangensis]
MRTHTNFPAEHARIQAAIDAKFQSIGHDPRKYDSIKDDVDGLLRRMNALEQKDDAQNQANGMGNPEYASTNTSSSTLVKTGSETSVEDGQVGICTDHSSDGQKQHFQSEDYDEDYDADVECDGDATDTADDQPICLHHVWILIIAGGIPQLHPQTIEAREDEPLLGRRGDVIQKDDESVFMNLFTGTAIVAQFGLWMLIILIWSGIFNHPLILFSAHPLLNSSAILLQVQAMLILQPTANPRQKTLGTRAHYIFQAFSIVAFIAALIVIEVNKGDHPRLTSPHGIMGLITYILIILQALGGVVQYFLPAQILGSLERGKRLYKYHRLSGYLLLVLELATVAAATRTTFNVSVLAIPLLTSSVTRPFSSSTVRRSDAALRPATAPKPTPDVKHIRQHPELYSKNSVDRNYPSHADYPFHIQRLSEEARRLDHDLKTPRSRIKQLEKTIGKLMSSARQNETDQTTTTTNQDELAALRAEAQRLKDDSQEMTSRKAACTEEIQRLALALPNLSSSETPVGADPKLIEYLNFDPQSPPDWLKRPHDPSRSHVAIGTSLGLIDFTSSATTTGWGWYFLINEGALLEQALIQYALSVARARGWRPVAPPSIVYSYIAEACGFQPRDQHNEQQIWAIEQSERDRHFKPQRSLAGTAEIPLAAMYAGRDFNAADLPLKLVGSSRCYRAEAGSRGVDTKGLYRVHEFTKVEMFAWADNLGDAQDTNVPTTSDDLFAELLSIQTEILTALGLPCRVLEMPTTDLGASATRKRDIEALFPSRMRASSASDDGAPALDFESAWGEVTSASICTEYQSRRLGTRVRGGKVKESRFPHTVNGTAIAVPRVLAALLENGWDAERGVVVVPEVLRHWMGGLEVIGPQ